MIVMEPSTWSRRKRRTAEILYDLLNLFEMNWDADIATAIYTGLLTDTGGFRYSNTSPKVMSIASDLLSMASTVRDCGNVTGGNDASTDEGAGSGVKHVKSVGGRQNSLGVRNA